METPGRIKPTISIENTTGSSRLVRTPSRDSVTTEISVGSCFDTRDTRDTRLSSMTGFPQHHPPQHMDHRSTALRVSFRCYEPHYSRGPSPSPNLSDRLLVPSAGSHRASSPAAKSIKDIWLDEENDLIRSCGALSKALGLQKSFSTSDILTSPHAGGCLRQSRSEMFLLEATNIHPTKLEANSRSLSTWVAVGDVQSSTSQLPSPQVELNRAFPDCDYGTQFTAADFVRSVNKRVRQNYIRRRLKVTYKALEQLSESEFDLDRLEQALRKTQNLQHKIRGKASKESTVNKVLVSVKSELPGLPEVIARSEIISSKEIERDRGKPISKYERNMMIFDWLHTLDESASVSHDLA